MPEKKRVAALHQRMRGLPRTWREFNLSLQLLGELREEGWHRSIWAHMPVDSQGNPIPWYAYPAVEWLQHRIRKSDRVFEWGAGASTLYFAPLVKEVISIEHDSEWVRKLRARVPENVTLVCRGHAMHANAKDEGAGYADVMSEYSPPFDIIAIDGINRNECAEQAALGIGDKGIVIFDDSHRPQYRRGMNCLAQSGLDRIDFMGFSPGNGTLGATSIFMRDAARWLSSDYPIWDKGL